MNLANFVLVFVGGGLGSALRYLVSLSLPGGAFPWATLCVNIVGSAAIGAFGALANRFGWPDCARLALTIGLCGGFTTFSTFSKESFALIESGRLGAFIAYAFSSVVLAIAAVALGFAFAKN